MNTVVRVGPAVASAGRALLLVAALAGLGWASGMPALQHEAAASQVMSMNEAASRVQRRFGGELVSIRPAEQDGEAGWQARVLLDNGKVKTVFVVARTGAVVDRKRG